MSIVDAIDDPHLFGAAIKDKSSFAAWRTLLKALFALPMDETETDVYRACTGRSELPVMAFGVLWLICGRRGGKSFMMAVIAVYFAAFKDWRRYLSPGERAVIAIVAADREQAKIIRRYIGGILEIPMFAKKVVSDNAEAIELMGNVVIEVATCSYRTVRGRSVCVALLDEVAFWRSESTVNPDKEVWRAIRASMAQFGSDGVAIIASSPYARRGLLFEGYKRYFGKPDERNLVWQASTKVMNPTISDDFLREEYEADAVSAEAEYGAQFRSDVEALLTPEVVEACIIPGRHELPPMPSIGYVGFIDAAGGSGQDSMTMAIAHRNGDSAVLDLVREKRPPFSPEKIVSEYSETLKFYGIRKVTADRWGGEFVIEAFSKHQITCEQSARPKSDIYRDALPLLNSGKVELLDHERLKSQLCGLERKVARGGRDSIDHAPGQHDDVANAACGALVAAGTGMNWLEVWTKLAS